MQRKGPRRLQLGLHRLTTSQPLAVDCGMAFCFDGNLVFLHAARFDPRGVSEVKAAQEAPIERAGNRRSESLSPDVLETCAKYYANDTYPLSHGPASPRVRLWGFVHGRRDRGLYMLSVQRQVSRSQCMLFRP